MNLKEKYENIVNEYLEVFSKKFEVDFEGWICGEVGGINEAADMFLNFETIRYTVDNNVSFEDLYNWYWFCVDLNEVSINQKNYMRFLQDYKDKQKEFSSEFNATEFHYWLLINRYVIQKEKEKNENTNK